MDNNGLSYDLGNDAMTAVTIEDDPEIVEISDDDDEPVSFDQGLDVNSIPEDYDEVNACPWRLNHKNDVEWLKTGDTARLKDESFLRIQAVLQSLRNEFYLYGILMKRTSDIKAGTWKTRDGSYEAVHDIFPDVKNMLCALVQPKKSLDHPPLRSGLVIRPVSDVICKELVILTNKFDKLHANSQNSNAVKKLYCCYKYTVGMKKTSYGMRARSWNISHLRFEECDQGEGHPSYVQNQDFLVWRTQIPRAKEDSIVSSSDEVHVPEVFTNLRQYATDFSSRGDVINDGGISQQPLETVSNAFEREVTNAQDQPWYRSGDLFSGAGGSALGLHQAGSDLAFAVDINKDACRTLKTNLPTCQVICKDLPHWLRTTGGSMFRLLLDILHISFICKAFSRANPGVNPTRDQMHVDLVYALYEILNRIRPRVVTLEQVDGILDNDKQAGHHLFAQFHALLSLGYQLRCDVLKMSDYGVAQSRKRLIIVASCPGQELPPWPKPTHGNAPGLKKPVTILDVLARAPRNERYPMNHSIRRPRPPPQDRNKVAPTITCGGLRNHPTEPRTFTVREQAMLQGFPTNYKFVGNVTEVLQQIGNAVPPPFAKALFSTIIETLRKTDKEFAKKEADMMEIVID